jgi:hypothetical protein
MQEKKEEQSIEEYWGLFRDSLPGAESSIEAIYRIIEVFNRQVDAFSSWDEREGRYSQLIVTRNRTPSNWKLSLTYWDHPSGEAVTVTSTSEVFSTAVSDLFHRLSKVLDKEVSQREGWVETAEVDLATLKKNLHIAENFRSSLGKYTPEQKNLPFKEPTKEPT